MLHALCYILHPKTQSHKRSPISLVVRKERLEFGGGSLLGRSFDISTARDSGHIPIPGLEVQYLGGCQYFGPFLGTLNNR